MTALQNGALTRRRFLVASAAGSVLLSIPFPVPAASTPKTGLKGTSALTAYLHLHANGDVTLMSPTSEMGQGTHTGHAAIVADELGIDISRITVVLPDQPTAPFRRGFGMSSSGSFGVRAWIGPLRKAAAQARTVLVETAAERWSVPAASCTVRDGMVVHEPSKQTLAYEALAAEAAGRTLPEEPQQRDVASRRYVGHTVPRVDTPAKITGTAVFGADVRLPGMAYGAVRLSPVFGAKVARIDPASAPGALAVVEIAGGAVVVAESWWQAKKLADGLDIEWLATAHETTGSAEVSAQLAAGLDGAEASRTVDQGDVSATLARAGQKVEARYEVPFLTHVSMEPICATAQLTDERCDVWVSTQGQSFVLRDLMQATGLPEERIYIHTTYLGGGFGRKGGNQEAVQAAMASKALGGRPVKVLWAREDDIQQGHYRPAMMAKMTGALTTDGRLSALDIRLSGPMMGPLLGLPLRNGFDPLSHAVLVDQPYATPAYRLDHHHVDVPPPLTAWRSVSSSQNGYFLESFIDELASAAGQDPLAFRRAHLADKPAHLAVLNAAAQKSGWGTRSLPAGWARGIALVESYGSRVAQVVEVEVTGDSYRVQHVHVAIDCGEAVNPGQVETQMVGSVIEALGTCLRCQITLSNGRAEQSNFDSYPILRIDEIPPIDVQIVSTGSPIGGVGEPGLPPTAPALANALFAATGIRQRRMPFSLMTA